jgi:hypothetical protein
LPGSALRWGEGGGREPHHGRNGQNSHSCRVPARAPARPQAASPTRGHAVVHLPAGVGQRARQLHVPLRLGAAHRTRVGAQRQHARHEAHKVVKLVLHLVAASGSGGGQERGWRRGRPCQPWGRRSAVQLQVFCADHLPPHWLAAPPPPGPTATRCSPPVKLGHIGVALGRGEHQLGDHFIHGLQPQRGASAQHAQRQAAPHAAGWQRDYSCGPTAWPECGSRPINVPDAAALRWGLKTRLSMLP